MVKQKKVAKAPPATKLGVAPKISKKRSRSESRSVSPSRKQASTSPSRKRARGSSPGPSKKSKPSTSSKTRSVSSTQEVSKSSLSPKVNSWKASVFVAGGKRVNTTIKWANVNRERRTKNGSYIISAPYGKSTASTFVKAADLK